MNLLGWSSISRPLAFQIIPFLRPSTDETVQWWDRSFLKLSIFDTVHIYDRLLFPAISNNLYFQRFFLVAFLIRLELIQCMESLKGLSGSFYDITRVAHGGNHIIRAKKNKINCILDSNHKLSDGIDYFWILLVPLSLFQPFILIRNPPHSTKNNFDQTKSSTPP